MPARLNMSFHNGNTYNAPVYKNSPPPANAPKFNIAAPRSTGLASSMIDRVHRAKPGCSACGKKIA